MSKLKALMELGSAWLKPKGVILAATAATGLYFFGGPAYSYVSTASRMVSTNVTESLPVEFEIERAKTMIEGLNPEIKKNMFNIAKEEVEIRALRDAIEQDEVVLAKREAEIKDFASIVGATDASKEFVFLGNRKVKLELATQQLTRAFDRFKADTSTFEKRQEVLANKEDCLNRARQALEQKLEVKRDLQVASEHLGARLKSLNYEESTNLVSFDENKFSKCRELVNSLKARLDVAEQLEVVERPLENISASGIIEVGDIVSEIDDFFAAKNGQSLETSNTKVASLE